MKHLMPCFFHPTTIAMVDDKDDFLDALTLALSNEYKCLPFNSAELALHYFQSQNNNVNAFINKYITKADELSDLETLPIMINIRSIHNEIYNKTERFEQISVIIVDYDMPEMNGLELCYRIRHLPFKVIMLTGVAEQQTAMEAFNNGLIDRFLVKNDNNCINKLKTYIADLQYEYFLEASMPILNILTSGIQSALLDPAYIALLNKVKLEHSCCEYYILEDSGSMLLLDDKLMQPVWLLIKTEEDMRMIAEIAFDSSDISISMLNMVCKREKLVHMATPHSHRLCTPDQWILQDAKILRGQHTYYYSIVSGREDYPLDRNRIVSYCQFLYSS